MVPVSVDVELDIFSCALFDMKEGPGDPRLWEGASNFCPFPTDRHLTRSSFSVSVTKMRALKTEGFYIVLENIRMTRLITV